MMAEAMTDIAEAFAAQGIRAYDYPAEKVQAPCIVVGYPEQLNLSLAFGNKGTSCTFPVYILAGKATDKNTRDALSEMLGKVKTALASLGGSIDADFQEVTVGGIPYVAAKIDIDWLFD